LSSEERQGILTDGINLQMICRSKCQETVRGSIFAFQGALMGNLIFRQASMSVFVFRMRFDSIRFHHYHSQGRSSIKLDKLGPLKFVRGRTRTDCARFRSNRRDGVMVLGMSSANR